LNFTYAVKQPAQMRATLVDSGITFLFDGKALFITSPKNRTVTKQVFNDANPAAMLMAVRNTFRAFVCEGWRPPMLSPRKVKGRTEYDSVDSGGAPLWFLRMPVEGSKTVKEVRYRLRGPGADFLYTAKVTHSGAILESTEVKKEFRDESTGLSFPKKWTVHIGAAGYQVELTDIKVNEGLTIDKFTQVIPEGYTVKIVDGTTQSAH